MFVMHIVAVLTGYTKLKNTYDVNNKWRCRDGSSSSSRTGMRAALYTRVAALRQKVTHYDRMH